MARAAAVAAKRVAIELGEKDAEDEKDDVEDEEQDVEVEPAAICDIIQRGTTKEEATLLIEQHNSRRPSRPVHALAHRATPTSWSSRQQRAGSDMGTPASLDGNGNLVGAAAARARQRQPRFVSPEQRTVGGVVRDAFARALAMGGVEAVSTVASADQRFGWTVRAADGGAALAREVERPRAERRRDG